MARRAAVRLPRRAAARPAPRGPSRAPATALAPRDVRPLELAGCVYFALALPHLGRRHRVLRPRGRRARPSAAPTCSPADSSPTSLALEMHRQPGHRPRPQRAARRRGRRPSDRQLRVPARRRRARRRPGGHLHLPGPLHACRPQRAHGAYLATMGRGLVDGHGWDGRAGRGLPARPSGHRLLGRRQLRRPRPLANSVAARAQAPPRCCQAAIGIDRCSSRGE